MSVCEKCWSDAGGKLERYLEILKEREDSPCTEREQKGVYYVEVEDRSLRNCSWCGGSCYDEFKNRRAEVFCSKSHRSSSNRALKRLRDKEK